ncbi:hypothetical protein K438DRAFT_1860731 [Mycena galopus ATCC 62051]|nr:hypothetical protein K438DRAFT_1860731 [Mycena galopus ATCC 62051]
MLAIFSLCIHIVHTWVRGVLPSWVLLLICRISLPAFVSLYIYFTFSVVFSLCNRTWT